MPYFKHLQQTTSSNNSGHSSGSLPVTTTPAMTDEFVTPQLRTPGGPSSVPSGGESNSLCIHFKHTSELLSLVFPSRLPKLGTFRHCTSSNSARRPQPFRCLVHIEFMQSGLPTCVPFMRFLGTRKLTEPNLGNQE